MDKSAGRKKEIWRKIKGPKSMGIESMGRKSEIVYARYGRDSMLEQPTLVVTFSLR